MSPIELESDQSPLRTYYLRALGETGDLPRLLVLIDRLPHSNDLLISRLQTLAFCGRTVAVGLQLLFDLTNGHTSITGHFSGLSCGCGVSQNQNQINFSSHRQWSSESAP